LIKKTDEETDKAALLLSEIIASIKVKYPWVASRTRSRTGRSRLKLSDQGFLA
jgi:hypothetical protein